MQKYLIEQVLFIHYATTVLKVNPTVSFLKEEIIRSSNKNAHIMGKLLGYSNDDIEYYYQYGAYQKYYIRQYNYKAWETLSEKPFDAWDETEKTAFNSFIKINQQWKSNYDADAQEAVNWFTENNNYSIEYLTNYGKACMQLLEFLNDPNTRQSATSSTQSIRTSSRWEQVKNALAATGIAAGLYGMWRYVYPSANK